MPRREKFGKFVLLEQIEATSLGPLFRAAKLGTTGFEKIVCILKLAPSFSANLGAAKRLMDQVKVAAPLQNPNILKIYGIGKVEASYYISYEFVEGKSLRQILSRAQQDVFPLSADHALLISSKICSALEAAHSRKGEAGRRYFHGLVNPSQIVVSYEGEIRVRGFGYWASRVREVVPLGDEEQLYLEPEQASGGEGSPSADLFAVGATLFEMLTGRALLHEGRDGAVAARVQAARLQSPTGESDALPPALSEILTRSLTGAYAHIQEMRKAIDTLLFSGDFTPTTFNLAFFMHSLFREDIDKETRTLDSEKRADYAEFLVEEPKAGLPKESAAPGATAEPGKATPAPLGTSAETVTFATPVPATRTPLPVSSHPAGGAKPPATPPEPPQFAFAKPAVKRRTPAPAIAALLVVAVAGAGLYFGLGPGRELLRPAPATTVPPTLSPEAAAAIARVKELEQRLSAMEAERAAAEAKAAEEAKKRVEAQARARGQEADPVAVKREEEDARKKARVEQEKRLEEERRRLEEQMRAEEARIAEERRRAEEQRKAEESARQAAAATTTPPPTTVPAVRPGMLVNLSDPGVIPPVVEKSTQLEYPQIALRSRIEGTVELSVLVDETGAVAEVRIISDGGSRVGLADAAVGSVKRRKYRPATKDGVPVKVWYPVRVQFTLPK